ncbi:MAG: excisionase family DNA-binding protein [Ignavibacteriales bacterium]|nr:MAG: excisionase family DNA-binding protein [Ignavibacteriales bacterium]
MNSNPESADEIALLSYSEAAKRMGIGRDTLKKLIRDGKLEL